MEDDLEENARMLLGLGLGDKRILEQILRASTHGEVISNHERHYIKTLMEKHAGSVPPKPAPKPKSTATKPKDTKPQTKKSQTPLIVAASAGVGAVVVIAAVLFMMMPTSPVEPVPTEAGYMNISQDAYNHGDFMLVTGMSDYAAGETIRINILDKNNNDIWSERVTLKPDGSYSTIILVGQDGWVAGEHTVQAIHGDIEYTLDFTFNG